MKRFFDGLKKAEEKLIAVLLAVMVIVIFAATIGRYTMLFSLPWAEELARYLMIWTVFIGAGAVAGEGGHYGVDIVIANLPPLGKKICYVLQEITVSAFCVFVAHYGMLNVISQRQKAQLSPAMQIPIWTMYLAVIIGLVLVFTQNIYHSVIAFRELDREKKEGSNA